MATELSRQKAAQAWCTPKTGNKVMDVDLCEAFAEILDEVTSRPLFERIQKEFNEAWERGIAMIGKH